MVRDPEGTRSHASDEVLVEDFLVDARRLIARLDRGPILDAVGIFLDVWRAGGTVFAAGNGGGHASAQHFASDIIMSTSGGSRPALRAHCLSDNTTLLSAIANDTGFEFTLDGPAQWIASRDVLVILSTHGGDELGAHPRSLNLARAATIARSRNARIIGIIGNPGGSIMPLLDVAVVVPSPRRTRMPAQVEWVQVLAHHLICEALHQRVGGA
jgi:D-sedoheptulose 7-phosphate isomerase